MSGAEKESFMLRHIRGLVGLSIALVVVFLISGSLALAQNVGSLRGTVVDPAGATVAGVNVKLIDLANSSERTTSTNEEGAFGFVQLNPGNYRLEMALLTSSAQFEFCEIDNSRGRVFSDEAGGTMAEIGLLPFARVALQVATRVLPAYR